MTEPVTQFDLEQHIMQCWSVVDDLDLLKGSDLTEENVKALKTLYQLKFERLFNVYEQFLQSTR